MNTKTLAAGIVGSVFGVAAMVQSCGGRDDATQPRATPAPPATTPIAITPNDGSVVNVTLDFSQCPAAEKPIWFAAQDGAGPWRQVLDAGDVYRFGVASAKGGYALVTQEHQRLVYVTLASRSELTAAASIRCVGRGTKTVSGTLAGITTDDVPYVGLGGGSTDPEGGPAARNFVVSGVRDGSQDFIAYRSNPATSATSDRAIIRRDLNISNNGSLGTIDFAGVESFAPATATLTLTAPSASVRMVYYTGARCTYSTLYDQRSVGTNFTMRGIPAAQQRATDFHVAVAYVLEPDYREAAEAFHTLANRVIALPAPLPAPAITTPPGGHKRFQVSLTLPSEYQDDLQVYYYEQGGAGGWVTASFAWLGGAAVSLAFPDLSDVTGWKKSFLPASNASVGWFIVAEGASQPAGVCVENARFVRAYLNGRQ